MLDPAAYLSRLSLDSQVGPPSLELLAHLQLAHLRAVPFENLHVFHRRGVRTDVEWSWDKIVRQRRGGWCFELNGSFGALLTRLGFSVDRVACEVWSEDRRAWGPPFDHLALVVHQDGARFLVDVGFGDGCLHPLLLESGESPATPRRARLDVDAAGFTLAELVVDGSGAAEWRPQLRGRFEPRRLDEFLPRSEALQRDPGSLFWQKLFATRALDGDGGRLTLRGSMLRTRRGTEAFEEREVPGDREWSELLFAHFGLRDVRTRDEAVAD